MKYAIYGLFDLSGIALYIGQTADPRARHGQWRRDARMQKPFTFKILHRVNYPNNFVAERKTIQRFKKRGQAGMNRVLPVDYGLVNRIKQLKTGETFTVLTDRERRDVLQMIRVLSLRIVTKKAKNGFTVTRLPE